ncbi:pyrroline-5-carboxylate reductase dimerization domain-containing protein [Pontixanthobacter aestiaquae]|uniref:Pyrroline-5-carboxylate reductase n=1 Tax=Pontixanthobacter aestiaquae TaxID=1509367 RepID=A0A844Z5F9_9SPHN|nr:pyrroline-5-carboxylate reductase dimerization domain-containing protein [Pontixanthobacter aestiaquae]MDN3646009.1 pyrroline-5-carboxylate reductase dimerization domain-containing protein [Pontixanthobacter aestiaquae]MXO82998.1 pyrroline-5-carboxylate reductase [Pontixanthobacter aestiaquae]
MAFDKILIVGFGTMTGAMVEGWLAAGSDPSRFEVYHPRTGEVAHGLKVHNKWPTGHFDAVLLGVKPHMVDDVAEGLEPILGPDTVLISVLAGNELESYTLRFPRAAGIVRFMPNLAAALRKSPNALIAAGLSDEHRDAVTQLASDIGTAEWLGNEAHFDLVTALAGSGPGFVYRFTDALASGAASLGLPEDQAARLAVAMVEGAGALSAASEYSPKELAQRVASPGGMTQKGLDVLDKSGALNALMTETLRAARDRGAEMAEAARGENRKNG